MLMLFLKFQSKRNAGLSRDNEAGQAVTEYILLLAVIVGFFGLALRLIRQQEIGRKFLKPVNESFVYAYRYGHPKARGPDDPGGPRKHPRYVTADGDGRENLRIFINPGPRN